MQRLKNFEKFPIGGASDHFLKNETGPKERGESAQGWVGGC